MAKCREFCFLLDKIRSKKLNLSNEQFYDDIVLSEGGTYYVVFLVYSICVYIYICIYMYIYVRVCVCDCVCIHDYRMVGEWDVV